MIPGLRFTGSFMMQNLVNMHQLGVWCYEGQESPAVSILQPRQTATMRDLLTQLLPLHHASKSSALQPRETHCMEALLAQARRLVQVPRLQRLRGWDHPPDAVVW